MNTEQAIRQINEDIQAAKAGVNALMMYGCCEKDLEKAMIKQETYTLCLSALRAQQSRCGCPCGEPDLNFCETCKRIRVDAIREKLERDNPQPLSLEELKERINRPIYLVHKAGGRHWDILEKITETTEHGKTEVKLFWRGGSDFGSGYYLECTRFYDHEPKEAR